jgi:hypothetical protein
LAASNRREVVSIFFFYSTEFAFSSGCTALFAFGSADRFLFVEILHDIGDINNQIRLIRTA